MTKTPDMTRLIFITDLHIGRPGADTYGVDVRANFLNVLAEVRALQPQALIIGGDVCFREPDGEVYAWVRDQLATLPFPVYAIAGNHDDAAMMQQVLGLTSEGTDALYYRHAFDGWPALFLDTSQATCSAAQYAWLERQLAEVGEALVFLHHPPMEAGVPYMDRNHAFREPRLLALLDRHPAPLHLFCGHYHVELSVHRRHLSVHITPSLFFQISRQTPDFAVDHYRVAWRLIELDGAHLRHEVRYREGARLPGA